MIRHSETNHKTFPLFFFVQWFLEAFLRFPNNPAEIIQLPLNNYFKTSSFVCDTIFKNIMNRTFRKIGNTDFNMSIYAIKSTLIRSSLIFAINYSVHDFVTRNNEYFTKMKIKHPITKLLERKKDT